MRDYLTAKSSVRSELPTEIAPHSHRTSIDYQWIRHRLSTGLAELVKNSELSTQIPIILEQAWRCIKCYNVNGCLSSHKVIRKTCKQCGMIRTNKLTAKEELIAIKACRENNWDYDGYLYKINSVR